MKTLIILTSFLAKKTTADFGQIKDQFLNQVKIRNASISGVLGAQLRSGELENFNDLMTYMNPIDGYGCWCHFGDSWHEAGGEVKDSIDRRCKELINGYRCAKIDAISRNENCDASTHPYTPYSYSFHHGFAGVGIEALDPTWTRWVLYQCEQANPNDQCAIDACQIEGHFTIHFLNDLVATYDGTGDIADSLNPDLQNSNGFQHKNECSTEKSERVKIDKECCGSIENGRAPYNVDTQGCCDDRTRGEVSFNLMTQVCCIDEISRFSELMNIGFCTYLNSPTTTTLASTTTTLATTTTTLAPTTTTLAPTTTTLAPTTTTLAPTTTTLASTTTTLAPTTTEPSIPDEVIEKLIEYGANNTDKDIAVTLTWYGGCDLDLHVFEPSGFEISYFNTSSPDGGHLDVDDGEYADYSGDGDMSEFVDELYIENIAWTTAPYGEYKIAVTNYDACVPLMPEVSYTVYLSIDGEITVFNGIAPAGDDQTYEILSFPFGSDRSQRMSQNIDVHHILIPGQKRVKN